MWNPEEKANRPKEWLRTGLLYIALLVSTGPEKRLVMWTGRDPAPMVIFGVHYLPYSTHPGNPCGYLVFLHGRLVVCAAYHTTSVVPMSSKQPSMRVAGPVYQYWCAFRRPIDHLDSAREAVVVGFL
jgi:hypothetical protein